jgi:ADP-ribose pyrophosphatase YjhB (NUDIX family)
MRSKDDTHRPLTWDLPGGSVEQGEDPTEAAKRETDEEASQKIDNLKILLVTSVNTDKYLITFIFQANSKSSEVILSDEHNLFKWVTPSDFLELDIPEKYKKAVKNLVLA